METTNENTNENQVPEIVNLPDGGDFITVDVDVPNSDIPTLSDIEQVKPKTKRGGKREGSGRKKKTGNTVINSEVSDTGTSEKPNEEQLINEVPQSESPEDALKEISSEINGKVSGFSPDLEIENAPIEEKKQYAVFISGYVLLTILNAFVPSLLTGLMKRANPKYAKLNPKNVALDKDEIEMLQPSADEVVKSIFDTMPPVAQFLFAYSIITAGKLILEIQAANE
jgi:hypothetical protein